jgi:hypothetical protein
MKTYPIAVGTVLIILIGVAGIIGCSQKQPQQQNIVDMTTFETFLASQQDTFKTQFKQVQEQYPAVAFALRLQESVIMELSDAQMAKTHQLQNLAEFLTGSDLTISERVMIEYRLCLRNLKVDLARSKNYEDGKAAFNTFNECLKKSERVRTPSE